MIKNYIFDFDGTLADSSIGIYRAFKSSCVKNNLEPPDIKMFKKHIGPPIYKLIYLIYPDIKQYKKENFVKTFRNEYDNKFFKIVDWYEEGLDHIYNNDNNGYTFGIYYYDGDAIVDVEMNEYFIKLYKGKIINIHPSLLPKYKGLNTHERVITNGEKFTGCTVHFVNKFLDYGKTIIKKKVRIKKN